MNRFLAGALAGCAATVPMTVAMVLVHRRLPWIERHPLPPEEITATIAKKVGLHDDLDEAEHETLTWLSHFGFGATMGALYAPVAARVSAPPVLKGAGFGLLVWATSYLGALPATGILHQPEEQPMRPNLMMIAAHLVWGACLGWLAERWEDGA